MIEVNVPLPDVETNCPHCNAQVLVPGYELTPWSDGFLRNTAYCEDCDKEFRVVVGDL